MSQSPDSQTGDPYAARAHARAQAGTQAEAMPAIPPRDAPPGVADQDLLWDEVIAGGGYASRTLARGARLELTDIRGDACASVLIFNAERVVERLNIADTLKVQWNAYLEAGRLLLSDMGRVLMSVEAADPPRFDAFCGPSTPWSNAAKYGEGRNHSPFPNARERFLIALGKLGMGAKDLHPCLNLFKPVRIEKDGAITLDCGPFAPGARVLLRAEMNVIIVMANCPHRLDPRADYQVTPLRARAWRGPITPDDDPIRLGAPEATRAFLQTEDYFRR